jgi:hypothetical protein
MPRLKIEKVALDRIRSDVAARVLTARVVDGFVRRKMLANVPVQAGVIDL